MKKQRKYIRPKDTNQLAKLIVDIATGQKDDKDPDAGKDPNAVALGRRGGKIGGKVRAKRLSARKRKEIAKKAAKKRWDRKKN